ncbi:tetratricopeptide (TPR) repeat protein [Crossiella equi]|uniref:Tetratricopeptide (TPR) repeat protein n=1 Tax=Crossiella equi TaxID=130796 RepID=A0ABS5ARI6_9PSEU|nr:tetratricopeptide repeat protein [Crossiella equi]MBP2479183.1 tetratricopeptide (TPR) repeat protein [Crossiella equi]
MDERLTAEGEIAVARLALDGGDLEHALEHVASAFEAAPGLPEAHEVLAELIARAGGPEAALELVEDTERQPGLVAVQAHVCAALGDWDEAVELLFAVAAYEPHRPWLDVAWLHQPDLPVGLEALANGVLELAKELDDPVDEDEREPLLPALTLLRNGISRHTEHEGFAELLWRGSLLARRLGATDEAVEWTRRSFELAPSHMAAVMQGMALRTAGRFDEALEVWVRETERSPEELDLYLDVANLLAALDRAEEGLDWVERVLAADPAHPAATATAHGLRYVLDEDAAHLVELADLARAEPGGAAHRELITRCSRRRWLDYVPQTHEAVTNLLGQLLTEHAPGPDLAMELGLSALEVPSTLMTLTFVYPDITVSVGDVREPDPREPVRPVRYAVWRFEGKDAVPALPPPPAEVATALQQAATPRWHSPLDAYDRAVALSGIDPEHLLSVMAHPPEPPEDEFGDVLARQVPHLWVRAVQVFAALGIAHHRADEPWATSHRRAILLDLLDGPEDWVTEAAAFALLTTAWVDPSARGDVPLRLTERLLALLEAFNQREVSILGTFCQLVLCTPNLPEGCAAVARKAMDAVEEEPVDEA